MGWTSYPRARRASVHLSWTRQRRGWGAEFFVGERFRVWSGGKVKVPPCRKERDKGGATGTTRSLDFARDDNVGESKSPPCRKGRDKGGATAFSSPGPCGSFV